jgi:hypothetical protein
VSRPVLDELDEISIGIDGIQNLVGDFQIRAFGTASDVVYLADIAVRPNRLDGTAVVLDVDSLPDVRAIAVDGEYFEAGNWMRRDRRP